MKRTISVIIFLFIVQACSSDLNKIISATPAHQAEKFNLDKSSEIIDRAGPAPDFILEYLRNLDNRKDYTEYSPSRVEIYLLTKYIQALPPLNRRMLKERLLGIYFINGFMSSGLTEWAVDKSGNVYSFMVLNPDVFKKDITELLSYKEKTNFISEKGYDIELDCGREYRGLFYILIHESTHVVDYAINITPYVEPAVRPLYKKKITETDFTKGIWKDYNISVEDFPFRKKITFYGMGPKPVTKFSDAPGLYAALSKSPFVTLYGSISWAEDLPEYITFYHLTKKLNQKFQINVYKDKKIIYSHEPMNRPEVLKRAEIIEKIFY